MSDAIDDIVEVYLSFVAGEPSSAEVDIVATWLGRIIAGASIERAVQVGANWRKTARVRLASRQLVAVTNCSSAAAARRAHQILSRLSRTHFRDGRAVKAVPADGEDRAWFAFLVTQGGDVPSERTLRRMYGAKVGHEPPLLVAKESSDGGSRCGTQIGRTRR